jgi:hypothetical protein
MGDRGYQVVKRKTDKKGKERNRSMTEDNAKVIA